MQLEPQVKLAADLNEVAAYLQVNGQDRLAHCVLDGLKVQQALHAALEASTTLVQRAIRGEA